MPNILKDFIWIKKKCRTSLSLSNWKSILLKIFITWLIILSLVRSLTDYNLVTHFPSNVYMNNACQGPWRCGIVETYWSVVVAQHGNIVFGKSVWCGYIPKPWKTTNPNSISMYPPATISKILDIVKRTFDTLNEEVLPILYKHQVRRHLGCGNVIWHPCHVADMKKSWRCAIKNY